MLHRLCVVHLCFALSFFTASVLPARAETDGMPLRIDVSAERMRVDGALKEWKGARFSELGSGDDASLRFALATADGGLYAGIEVRDERLVTGDKGDAVVLTLQMPDAAALHTSELYLLPGQSGKSQARALLATGAQKPRLEPRIQIVEGPRADGAGYLIEAFIPWTCIRGAEVWEQGRGALRFVDVDDTRGSTLTTAPARAGTLPRLVLGEGNRDLLGSFLQANGLIGVEPRYDLRANVSGDAQPERVVIVDRYVVVYGPGYHAGETFDYYALPLSVGGALLDAQLADLTGDGRAELMTRLRQQNALGNREVWLAIGLSEGNLQPLFGVELKKKVKDGFLESSLALGPVQKGKPRRIEVRVGRAEGLDATTYQEAQATDVQPILLPWGDLEQRSYAFDGKRFAVVEEKHRKIPAGTPVVAPPPGTLKPEAQETNEPSASEPSTSAVLAQFKEKAQLPSGAKPSRTLRANVLSGAAPEQVDVFGSVLVLTGPDIAGGAGYVTYAAPVADARELLDVRAVDVTSDGVAELLVRVVQKLTGAAGAERELLLVVRGDASGRIARAAVIEIARRLRSAPSAKAKRADDPPAGSIENRVLTQSGTLTIEPGSATGWTQQSYPFGPEPIAGSEPLLLPWRDRAVRYRSEGAVLVPVR